MILRTSLDQVGRPNSAAGWRGCALLGDGVRVDRFLRKSISPRRSHSETRSEYYRQLDMASRSGGDVIPFIRYAMQGFVDGLRDQINVVRDQQIDVAWINFVHGAFHGAHGPTTDRRRDLVLQMSAPAHRANFLAIDQIPLISPRLAKLYATKSSKTLRRDLNELVRMGLVRRDSDGRFKVAIEIMSAFLPARSTPVMPRPTVRQG